METRWGESINDACKRAKEEAQLKGRKVSFTFNGIHMSVRPESCIEDLLTIFDLHKFIERKC